ncbi:MAG TPA: DMT family transporter [Solirubrobacteraceae bacterium]|nr:DMT family transporter [Solirubrobacteraceae bacterium]
MSRTGWAAFAAMSVLWGGSYLLIEIAERGGMSAMWVAWLRVVIAAVVLMGLAARAGTLGALRGRWRGILGYAVIEVSLPFPLIATGEVHVASSLTAIIIAAVPLFGALLAMRFDHDERPTATRAAGLGLGFAGVIVLVGLDVASSTAELIGAGAILLAALGYAIGPMLVKHALAGLDPRAMMGSSLAIAAVILTLPALFDPPSGRVDAGAIVCVIALGLVCTAAAFVIFAVLIREAGPSRATVITYVNPVVALGLGMGLEDERPGPAAIVGLVLILAGSWLATAGAGGRRLPRWARRQAGSVR